MENASLVMIANMFIPLLQLPLKHPLVSAVICIE